MGDRWSHCIGFPTLHIVIGYCSDDSNSTSPYDGWRRCKNNRSLFLFLTPLLLPFQDISSPLTHLCIQNPCFFFFLPRSFFLIFVLLKQGDKVRVVQTILFVTGINTLLQTLFGTRLPTVVGGSYAFIVPIVSIIHDSSLSQIADGHTVCIICLFYCLYPSVCVCVYNWTMIIYFFGFVFVNCIRDLYKAWGQSKELW